MIKYKTCTGCERILEENENNFGWKNKKNNKFQARYKICISNYGKKYRKKIIKCLLLNQKYIEKKCKKI